MQIMPGTECEASVQNVIVSGQDNAQHIASASHDTEPNPSPTRTTKHKQQEIQCKSTAAQAFLPLEELHYTLDL